MFSFSFFSVNYRASHCLYIVFLRIPLYIFIQLLRFFFIILVFYRFILFTLQIILFISFFFVIILCCMYVLRGLVLQHKMLYLFTYLSLS